MKSPPKYQVLLELANGDLTRQWLTRTCKKHGWKVHPFDQAAQIIREVQGEIQHAFSILVPRETEELSAGGGSLNREDAPLLYASKVYSYSLNHKGKPEPNIRINLTFMAEELEKRKVRLVKDTSDIPAELEQIIIGSMRALPSVAIIAVFEFWRFMDSNHHLRMCKNCPQFFITGDARKLYCDGGRQAEVL